MATSFHLVNNNAASTLASAIDDNDLSASVASGEGAEFDTGKQYLTIGRDTASGYAGEIVDVTSRSTDAFTIASRGADGTTATSHEAGEAVECLLVAAHITEIQDAINGIENGTTTLAKVVASGSAASTLTVDDSGTNTAVSVLELYHTSSGTPASGLGAKLLIGAEDSAGNKEAAVEIHGILTTVTNTSEQGKLLVRVKNAGSFMDALEITVASNTVTIATNQTTLNFCNASATTANILQAATTSTWFADSGSSTHTFRGATFVFGPVATNGDTTIQVYELQNNTNPPTIQYRKARFSAGAAAQVQANDYLGAFGYVGYTNTPGYGITSAFFRVKALDNFTSTAQGTSFIFETTIAGSVTRSQIMELNWSGNSLYGNTTFGSLSTHTYTFTGRMIVRSVTDAGPMTATGGTQKEIVYNTSDNKFYGCTATHATAATWAAFH